MNTVLNKNTSGVKGCRLYVALFPCNECTKIVIQSGTKKVIYFLDKHASKKSTIATKQMFNPAGVEYLQFIPKNQTDCNDFTNLDHLSQLPETPVKST